MRVNNFLSQLLFNSSTFFVLTLLIITLSIAYGHYVQKQSLKEARVFVSVTMLKLFADWNKDQLFYHSSLDLKQNMSDADVNKLSTTFSHLGDLLRYDGAQGGAVRLDKSWWKIAARYQVRATFERGAFIATITLVKNEEDWQIGQFHYNYTFFPIERDEKLRLI